MTPRLIGMVHLGPLPGAPRFRGDLPAVIDRAVADAETLAAAGFDGLLVENYGDAPFDPDDAPKATIAAMARAVAAVSEVGPTVGVNVLRNDALGALAVAAATGASFIRVNVLAGVMHTDQGTLRGRAHQVARLRESLGADVRVYADAMVKHALPPAGLELEQAASDLWHRAGADAVVVSGTATGRPVDDTDLKRVSSVLPDAPLLVGSGADAASARRLLGVCSGLIVGTSLKVGGVTEAPVDPKRARAFVEAAS